MPTQEDSNPIVIDLKENNLAKAHQKDLKTAITNMFKDFKANKNKQLNIDHEKTKS